LRWLQLAFNVRTARAKACQVALFKWQGADDFGVDTDAVAPAGLVDGCRVCHGTVVAGPACRANLGSGHVWVSVVGQALNRSIVNAVEGVRIFMRGAYENSLIFQ